MKPPEVGPEASQASALRSARLLLADLPGLLSDRVHLLALELLQARVALGQLVLLLMATSVVLGTAWVLLCVGLMLLALQAGWPLVLAVGLPVALNLGLGAWAVWHARSLLPLLTLPATIRRLTSWSSAPEGPDAAPRMS
jgi:hypothetical protein